MKTVPVIATIRDAYRFTLSHLGAIIGLIWLPMILLTVIGFFVLQRYYAALADALASGSYATMGPQVLGLICYLFAGILLVTMMSVPVTQLALGTRKDGALIHFAFSTMEWRLFRGIMGLLGFLLVPLLVVGIAAGLVQGDMAAGQASQLLQLLVLGFYLAAIYFLLRFGVLLPALAASENGPMLARAWALSGGNFWRILVIMAAVVMPVMVLSVVIQYLASGRQMASGVASSTAMAAAQFNQMAQQMPLTSGVNFLLAPLLLGLILSAGAGIYRALTAGSELT